MDERSSRSRVERAEFRRFGSRVNTQRSLTAWQDFIVYFVVLALAVAALGFGITTRVRVADERNAMIDALQQANVIDRIAKPLIALFDSGKLPPRVNRVLLGGLPGAIASGALSGLAVWSNSGPTPKLVFSTGESSRQIPLAAEIRGALATGAPQEKIVYASKGAKRVMTSAAMVVYPLPKNRALVVFISYGAIAARFSSQLFRFYFVFSIAFALLYGIVVAIAWSAGRKFRRQLQVNFRLATTDSLTKLPNRTAFGDRLAEALENAQRTGKAFVVALADADHFKEVNDILGHDVGDRLIEAISQRFRAVVFEPDVVARTGGDEFAFLFSAAVSEEAATHAIELLRDVLRTPIDLDGLPIFVEASIGVSVFPRDGTDARTLLRHADIALYSAKGAGTQLAFFEPILEGQLPERLVLGSDIRRGLNEGEFGLYYQPKIEVKTGRAVGVEGLLRWHHPARGIVLPDDFLPFAERTSLVHDIDSFVLRQAAAQLATWEQGLSPATLSVNVSARSLNRAFHLDEVVFGVLDEFGVQPNRLCIEVTETAVLAESSQAAAILGRLAEAGVHIALDDFGRGYTGIGLLRTLPLDELKIDKRYVERVVDSPADAAVLRSMVDLAHALGMRATAEGVETAEVLAGATRVGCDLAQGFLIAEPLSIEELNGWLATRLPLAPQDE
jgi:diguanylate cyclase (GGDEF)-like protein